LFSWNVVSPTKMCINSFMVNASCVMSIYDMFSFSF
jgi:hypothetical protein